MNTLEYLTLNRKERGIISRFYIYGNIENGIVRRWYHPYGINLFEEYEIKNDELNGIYKNWNEKGELIAHELWENGKFIKDLIK